MLTDSLHTRFNQDMYSRGEMVMDHDARHGYVVKDLLVYFINSADSKDTTLGPAVAATLGTHFWAALVRTANVRGCTVKRLHWCKQLHQQKS
jgi:hypothetical protein